MEKTIMVEIFPSNIAEMLCGIEIMCNSLTADALEWSLPGILTMDGERTKEQNAYDFLCQHYGELQGAIRAAGATVSIINSAIANGSIKFVAEE